MGNAENNSSLSDNASQIILSINRRRGPTACRLDMFLELRAVQNPGTKDTQKLSGSIYFSATWLSAGRLLSTAPLLSHEQLHFLRCTRKSEAIPARVAQPWRLWEAAGAFCLGASPLAHC